MVRIILTIACVVCIIVCLVIGAIQYANRPKAKGPETEKTHPGLYLYLLTNDPTYLAIPDTTDETKGR